MNVSSRAEAYRWLGGSALALLGHAVVAGGLMYQGTPVPPDGAGAPVHVELAGDFAAPARVEVAGAREEAADPPSPVVEKVPDSPPLPEPIPEPEPESELPEPVKQSPVDDTRPTEIAKRVAKPDAAAENASDGASSLPTVTADRAAEVVQATAAEAATHMAGLRASWQGRVKAHLEQHKQYPHSARTRREQGTARVRFTLDRRGRVQAVHLEESAGFPLLDREVREALRRAQPLPEPPAELAGEVLELIWRVEFVLR